MVFFNGVFMKNVVVIFGGKSCEREISVITGVLTLNSVDKEKYNPIPVYVNGSGEWLTGEELFDISFFKNGDYKRLKRVTLVTGENSLYLKGKRLKKLCDVYAVINCMHGLNGEDGSLAGLTQLSSIALVGSPLFASSFSMDKEYQKFVLKGLNVPVLPFITVKKQDFFKGAEECIEQIEKKLSYPLIIKPANLGSSIGISTAFSKEELLGSLKKAFLYDGKVIIENYLEDFIEYNLAVCETLDGVILSEVEKPCKSDKILSFKDKYESSQDLIDREFPAKISKSLDKKIKAIGEKVYNICGFSGIIRIDYIYYKDKIYLNEINSVPGSLSYYLLTKNLKDFTALLSSLIEKSVQNLNQSKSRVFSYSSRVLSVSGAKGNKRLTRKN